MMHDGMPYNRTQGQGQGHECLKATQEESTRQSRTVLIFNHKICLLTEIQTTTTDRNMEGGWQRAWQAVPDVTSRDEKCW